MLLIPVRVLRILLAASSKVSARFRKPPIRDHFPFSGSKSLLIKSILSSSLDRKSTRLNSSHVRISYAVFCLKKKNNIDDDRLRPDLRVTDAVEGPDG